MAAAPDTTQSSSTTDCAARVGFLGSTAFILQSGNQRLAVKTFQDLEYSIPSYETPPQGVLHPQKPTSSRKIPDHTALFPLLSEHRWPARCSWHLPRHYLVTLPVFPFMTPVLLDHLFVGGFVGTSSTKQCIPQGQGLSISLQH